MRVFRPRSELAAKLAVLALAVSIGSALALAVWRVDSFSRPGNPLAQPIPFSHKHHVGDDGIDCRYCHTTVETAAHAGLPSTGICLSCHSQLYADQPLLEPLLRSAASGDPIAWRRVHRLPDFVYFPHDVHVARGVACFECHGRVDQMPLTWRAVRLEMQWCLSCHRNPGPRLHAADQVTAMPPAPAAPAERQRRLRALHDERRRTDCSTCHR